MDASRISKTSKKRKLIDTGAPAQKTQPSRKGKKAWRKNVDIDEVEAGLEGLREEERVTGYVLDNPMFGIVNVLISCWDLCDVAESYRIVKTRICSNSMLSAMNKVHFLSMSMLMLSF